MQVVSEENKWLMNLRKTKAGLVNTQDKVMKEKTQIQKEKISKEWMFKFRFKKWIQKDKIWLKKMRRKMEIKEKKKWFKKIEDRIIMRRAKKPQGEQELNESERRDMKWMYQLQSEESMQISNESKKERKLRQIPICSNTCKLKNLVFHRYVSLANNLRPTEKSISYSLHQKLLKSLVMKKNTSTV